MAIALPGPLATVVRGSVGDTTFRWSRGQQVISAKPIPPVHITPAALAAKQVFRAATRIWTLLDEQTRRRVLDEEVMDGEKGYARLLQGLLGMGYHGTWFHLTEGVGPAHVVDVFVRRAGPYLRFQWRFEGARPPRTRLCAAAVQPDGSVEYLTAFGSRGQVLQVRGVAGFGMVLPIHLDIYGNVTGVGGIGAGRLLLPA